MTKLFHVEQKHTMNYEELRSNFRCVHDFPRKGIVFRDITTVVKNPECLQFIVDRLYERYRDLGITKVAGIESRGFIFAPILAYRLNVGFVPIRKKSKLPAEVYEETYQKEYGTDTIAIHKDAIKSTDVVLLHDDMLATGGTMVAACNLIRKIGVETIYMDFISELDDLGGRKILEGYGKVESLVHF